MTSPDPKRLSASVFFGDPDRIAAPAPVLSPDLLSFVAERYGLSVTSPVDLGGSFNLNVLVDDCVVRMYGPWVGADRVADLQRVRNTLHGRGIATPELVPTVEGSTLCEFGDRVIEVDRYVRGERMSAYEQLLPGMVGLGRLHAQMADLDIACPPPIANHLPQERAVDATAAAVAYVRDHDPTPLDEHYCAVAEKLADLLSVYPLPSQLVHGDYWDNNVLFRDTTMVAVLDFDFAGVRPRVDDLALPLGYLMQAEGYGAEPIRELIAAYDSGADQPLTPTEREALPFAMARMALFFLQYLLIPGDDAYTNHARREFREQRGPVCEWWLNALERGTISAETFI